ncbi:hypothetical protein Q5M85_22815 [Paraclostridium bifermentans]|nr:hypothetical protein [Paraclostridium bifermentans]
MDKFASNLKVGIAYGDKKSRELIIENYRDYDVVLTTYSTIRNDFEKYKNKNLTICS